MRDDYSLYFSGKKLYGDDFDFEDIQKWFEDEEDAYADLGAKEKVSYQYDYHQLNIQHAFNFLSKTAFRDVLGIGSAYGEEFKPIVGKINKITILDPSDTFSNVKDFHGAECTYIKPHPSGDMPFSSGRFDLVTCLGVMHHIPNVSSVMHECYRCLADEGIMILREPIISMGDWRKPRKGLTKRERGIPLSIFDKIIKDLGFKVKRRTLCQFPVIPRITNKLGISAYNNATLTFLDKLLCQLFAWNVKYHQTRMYEKLSPSSVCLVLQK